MIFNDKGEPVKMGYDGAESVSRHRNWLNNNSPVDHSEEQVLDFHKRNTLVAHLYDLYRSDTICYAIVEAMVTNSITFPLPPPPAIPLVLEDNPARYPTVTVASPKSVAFPVEAIVM